jgi:hypothetical protein
VRNPLKVRSAGYGYGFFPGGDPRLFHPDGDGQTEEEAENHRQACAAWDAGSTTSESDGTYIPGVGFIDRCQFGLGSYEWTEDLWLWDWIRYDSWPRLKNRVWWRWHLDMRNWAETRGLLRWRFARRLFDEGR